MDDLDTIEARNEATERKLNEAAAARALEAKQTAEANAATAQRRATVPA